MVFIFALILLLAQVLLFGLHFLLYKTVISIFGLNNPTFLLVLKLALGLLSFGFILVSILVSRYNTSVSKVIYYFGTAWLGFALYFLFASLLYWSFIRLFPGLPKMILGSALLGVAFLIGLYGLIHAESLVIKTVRSDLGPQFSGKKAVWVSDLHLGPVHGENFSKEVVDRINALDPDVVFVGGDLYDGTAVDIEKVIEPFSRLKPPLGTYFITGNHEEFGDDTKYLEAIRRIGIKVLNNEAVDLGGVRLIGVDYKTTSLGPEYQKIIASLTSDKKEPIILLRHVPSQLSIGEEAGIDLQISGHAHDAQMVPLNFITKLVFNGYEYGLHNFGKMKVYTSSGTGTWGPPLRVGTDSEIVLFEFK